MHILEEIAGYHGVIDDGNGLYSLRELIAEVNRAPTELIALARRWRDETPAESWPHRLAGLLYTPRAVPRLSGVLLDALVSLDGGPEPIALRRFPAGVATPFDADVVVDRFWSSAMELGRETDVEQRIASYATLVERVLAAFDQAIRPETKVVHRDDTLRPFRERARLPIAHVLVEILRDARSCQIDRRALFRRLWTWLRQGWLDALRDENLPAQLATLVMSADDVDDIVAMLRAETQSVRQSPTFRPLLFALLGQRGDADGMREALPPSPTWAHHEAIARAYEKADRRGDAVAFLQSLKPSTERDALLVRMLATTNQDAAFELERVHPSNLDTLAARYGKTRSELIARGLERMHAEEVRVSSLALFHRQSLTLVRDAPGSISRSA
jgi:hypothetical protein